MRSVPRDYKKTKDIIEGSSFETPVCQGRSLEVELSGKVRESLDRAVE
jgi:hypothetical protein